MREIVLHLLDLAENSVSAGARTVWIEVCEDLEADRLTVRLADDGCGMDPETVAKVTDPFYTGRTTRNVGLGIPLLKEAAEAAGGGMTIRSTPGQGTEILVEFQHSHIDRMPLGNLAETLRGLTVAHPEVRWIDRYTARKDGLERTFEFDDQPVKQILTDVPLTHPDVLAYLRSTIEEGLAEAQSLLDPAP